MNAKPAWQPPKEPNFVWKDGAAGWRYTTPDGHFDSRLYPTRAECERAAKRRP
jgi:hypothetical protein